MAAVLSPSLRMAGAGLLSRVCSCTLSLQVLWPAAAQSPWWVTHASHKGAVERTKDFVHKGRVWRLGLRFSEDGGLQLLAQCQRPDLVDREDGAQVGRSGGLCRPFWDGFQLLPAVEVEPPHRSPHPGVWPAALRSPSEAVEGMAWVPSTGRPRHDGRQGVRGLAWEQGGGAWSPGAWSRRPPSFSGSHVGAG